MCACTRVQMREHANARARIRMLERKTAHAQARMRTCAHVRMRGCGQARVHTGAHALTRNGAYAQAHPCTPARVHASMRANEHVWGAGAWFHGGAVACARARARTRTYVLLTRVHGRTRAYVRGRACAHAWVGDDAGIRTWARVRVRMRADAITRNEQACTRASMHAMRAHA